MQTTIRNHQSERSAIINPKRRKTLTRLPRSLYFSLVITIALCVTFRSIQQWMFLAEQNQAVANHGPLLFYAQLDPNFIEADSESIVNQVSSLPDIQTAHIDQPIPPWNGSAELENQWNQMWKQYLTPMILITTELQRSNLSRAPEIAGEILHVPGINKVVWDESAYNYLVLEIQGIQRTLHFYTNFSLCIMAALVGGLILSYPYHLRRRFAIQTGMGGAGSQINPELVLLKMILLHLVSALCLYGLATFLAYCFLPVPLPSDGRVPLWPTLGEGAVVTTGLITAVFLIGWWLPVPSRRSSHAVPLRHDDWSFE